MRIKRHKFKGKPPRKINKIIIHCSATDKEEFDNPESIKLLHTLPKQFKVEWDKELIDCRGWMDIGYHFVIVKRGRVFKGRDLAIAGAHTWNHNQDSIGICVTGLHQFTSDQMTALYYLVQDLCIWLELDPRESVFPHNYFTQYKSCPNFKLPEFYVNSEYLKHQAKKIGGMEAL